MSKSEQYYSSMSSIADKFNSNLSLLIEIGLEKDPGNKDLLHLRRVFRFSKAISETCVLDTVAPDIWKHRKHIQDENEEILFNPETIAQLRSSKTVYAKYCATIFSVIQFIQSQRQKIGKEERKSILTVLGCIVDLCGEYKALTEFGYNFYSTFRDKLYQKR